MDDYLALFDLLDPPDLKCAGPRKPHLMLTQGEGLITKKCNEFLYMFLKRGSMIAPTLAK